MTIDDLIQLGNENPVVYRGAVVTFVCLSQRYVPGSSRRQPMKARIREGRREMVVSPSQLSPTPAVPQLDDLLPSDALRKVLP